MPELDLHILADLVGEQVAVVGNEDYRLDPMVAQDANASSQMPSG